MDFSKFWMDPIGVVFNWLMLTFTGWGMSGIWAYILLSLIGIVVLVMFAMVVDIMLVWVERKVVARFQGRLGPNRVGPFGLFQPFPDIIKLIIKEDITPEGADKVVFNMAPVISAMSVIILWAVFPLAARIYGTDLNVAVLYLVAAGAFGTLAVIMAGWSSNNKYALLGAFRSVATMISFEIPLVVALMIPVIITGSMSLKTISEAQINGVPFILVAPLAFIIFLISAIAELGRSPFDLNEGESEIVSGFHIEYSGMKFGWFYAGELLHSYTVGGLMGILFFGGWGWFGLEKISWLGWLGSPLFSVVAVLGKALIGYWIIMWIKYTVPRIRIDHMLAFNWKFLTPLSFALLIMTAVCHSLLKGYIGNNLLIYVVGMLASNLLFGWVTLEILRAVSRKERALAQAPKPVAQH
jgi:NADH-quinone oxidoreductase subunit H